MPDQSSSPGRRRILIGAGLAAAVAIVVVALSTGGSETVSLADAAAKMEGQSARARFDMDIMENGEAYSFAGTGMFTSDNSKSRMGGMFRQGGESYDAEVILIGDEAWFTSKALAGNFPKGKRWLHMVDKSSAPKTMSLSQFVGFLKDADEVENLGEEQVAGTTATHYSGKLDVQELVEATGGEAAERFKGRVEGLKLPIDVWVTPDGLPKVMKVDFQQGGEKVRMEIELLEYDVPVDVEPPPERTVIEEDELGG